MFFFKQKTAYEMRISYWSSDVCSSDLTRRQAAGFDDLVAVPGRREPRHAGCRDRGAAADAGAVVPAARARADRDGRAPDLLRAASAAQRSEERRVGKECVRTYRSGV